MSYCLNLRCDRPQNPDGAKFCLTCGSRLLLRDRYRALKPIGQGGFGKTFLAIDEDRPSRPACVIKQFLPQAQGNSSCEAAAQFAQEAARLEELGHHDQIPTLMAYFTHDQQPYLVQEFIDGLSLAAVIESEGTFDEVQVRDLLDRLLPVLSFVHDRAVIHRDIKPENLIRRSDGQWVLVDFGAAKVALGSAAHQTGTAIGSAEYVAPEQVRGKAVFASDLYSLGVTCLYALTGVSPFDLFDPAENVWVWRDYLTGKTLSDTVPQARDRLGQILDRLIEPTLNRRYPSAAAVLQDLKPVNLLRVAAPSSISSSTNWRCTLTLKHSGLIAGIQAIAFHSQPESEPLLASASEDGSVKIWNLITGAERSTLSTDVTMFCSVCFSPNGQLLAAGRANGEIFLWDWQRGTEPHRLKPHRGKVTAIAFSRNGKILIGASQIKAIGLWNVQTGKLIHTLPPQPSMVKSLALNFDGSVMASSAGNKIQLWRRSPESYEMANLLARHTGEINSIAFSAGDLLASGGMNNEIHIWNARDELHLWQLKGHKSSLNGVNRVAFSPDETRLASAGGDRTVRLWNVQNGELLDTIVGHTKGVTDVLFTPEGDLLSCSLDRTIRLWQR